MHHPLAVICSEQEIVPSCWSPRLVASTLHVLEKLTKAECDLEGPGFRFFVFPLFFFSFSVPFIFHLSLFIVPFSIYSSAQNLFFGPSIADRFLATFLFKKSMFEPSREAYPLEAFFFFLFLCFFLNFFIFYLKIIGKFSFLGKEGRFFLFSLFLICFDNFFIPPTKVFEFVKLILRPSRSQQNAKVLT